MAERRMFAIRVIDSDEFLDMPGSARLLYYDLGMRADDDGFVNSVKKIIRMTGASQEDLSALIKKNFIIMFDNGIVVITHWKIHNYIRRDTYRETDYRTEKMMLNTNDDNSYQKIKDKLSVDEPSTTRGRPVDGSWTQDRIIEDRIIKENNFLTEITKEKTEKKSRKAFPNTKTVKKTLPKNTSKMNRNNVADDTDMIIKQLEESGGENF